jgi:hypothetical protein
MTTRAFQFEADFERPGHQVLRASTTLRPDAVTLDYLTAWSTGPVAVGDISQGYEARCWYAVARGQSIYLARADATNRKWETEQLLYTYTGAPATEISLAFTRAGWPIVAMERPTGTAGAPQIWILWRDPLF